MYTCVIASLPFIELLRDAFGEEKFCHILVAELKDLSNGKSPTSKLWYNCVLLKDMRYKPPILCKTTENTAVSRPNDLPSEKMEKNERLVGYALYYYTYSTWNGRALYVEDLFVREEHRSGNVVTFYA